MRMKTGVKLTFIGRITLSTSTISNKLGVIGGLV